MDRFAMTAETDDGASLQCPFDYLVKQQESSLCAAIF